MGYRGELRNFANWPAECGKIFHGKLWALMMMCVAAAGDVGAEGHEASDADGEKQEAGVDERREG